ncbi:MAG TPA: ATP-binding protein [Deltaproteobacteria bacterium]|nr:ATP-binding protein [Deltaproteobacteria bacterium]
MNCRLLTGFIESIRRNMMISLLLTLIAVVSVVSVLSTVYFNKTNSKSLHEYLENTVTNSLKFAQIGYSTTLWNIDLRSINKLNEAILHNQMLVAVNIISDGAFLCGLKKESAGGKENFQNLISPYEIDPADRHTRKVSGDIYYNNEMIGAVEIFYTENLVMDAISQGSRRIIATFVIIAVVIIVTVFFNLNKKALRPILNLAHVSQEIAGSSNYSIRVEKSSNDEIGVLYDGFNNMLDQIEKRESERRKAEKELEYARNLLNNVVNSMPSVLISTDAQGKITHWNNSAIYHIGITCAEAVGRELWDIAPMFQRYRDDYNAVIRTQMPMEHYRETFDHAENRYYNVTLFPLISEGPQGVVIRMDDVTELEEKDNELRQAQKMESIGMLAGGIAHDFNNVLVGIVGSISILQHKLQSSELLKNEETAKFIKVMHNASLRATDMVQQLLTLSKKQELSLTQVDLNETIINVLKICQNTFEKNIELKTSLPEAPTLVLADETQLEQVILNLCINAYHAMSIMRTDAADASGSLNISLNEIRPDRHFYQAHLEAADTMYWRISIEDTGVGMNKETLSKIFDPFFTTKQKDKGTGLGLTVVYNIVQQHGGFIDVHSECNKGTTFEIYLPKPQSSDLSEKIVKDEIVHKGEGLILVVDDEEMVRYLARIILEECGYEVIFAEDGEQAIQLFREHHNNIRAVLLDMVMPKKVGKDTYIEMKSIDKEVKVLLSSGFKKDERVEAVLKLGVNGFIQKPYTISNLSNALHTILHPADVRTDG